MKLQKVFFETEDGIELCGLLHEAEETSNQIVIAIHGMQSNCFKKRDDFIAEKLTKAGISYFCFNNRGHDLVNSLSQIKEGKNNKTTCGSCLEDVEDSYYDIKAAIEAMNKKGYTKIHLQGHSLGCTKIVYTYNRMLEEKNTNVLEKIKSVILLSMVDLPNAMNFFFSGDKEKLVKFMENEVKEGRGDTLISIPDAILPMSPNTFLRYMKNNKSIDFAKYSDENYDFKELNAINVPLFMRWGNNHELITQDACDLVKMLQIKIKNPHKDLNFIDGAAHNYKDKEEILAGQILNFLKSN